MSDLARLAEHAVEMAAGMAAEMAAGMIDE